MLISCWSGAVMGVTCYLGRIKKNNGVIMRKATIARGLSVLLISTALTACGEITDEDRNIGDQPLNVIDASDLNDIMLNFADPDEAVSYFQEAAANEPERVEFRQGLAKSLMQAGRYPEAVLVFEQLSEEGALTNEDRLLYAEAYIREGAWDEGEAQLNAVPPTFETYDRYRLEALVADHNEDWNRADSFYDIARGLTTAPANVLNNWGYSKRVRGDLEEAQKLFKLALRHNPDLYIAKSNLVIVRGMQGEYRLPIIPMTEAERATLLYELARVATQRGDIDIARGLLETAIDTHPRHFEAAVAALEVLTTNARP